MNVGNLNTQKIEFVKQFLNENNEDVLQKVIVYFKEIRKETLSFPCQMTEDELKKEVEQAEKEIALGNYVTQEEMRKKHLL